MTTMNQLELLYNGDRLGDLLELLDELHSAASENRLQTCTTLPENELLDLLKEVIYTAQETIEEIETAKQARRAKAGRATVVQFVTPDAVQETRHA
jgi:phage tail tape-measure protein